MLNLSIGENMLSLHSGQNIFSGFLAIASAFSNGADAVSGCVIGKGKLGIHGASHSTHDLHHWNALYEEQCGRRRCRTQLSPNTVQFYPSTSSPLFVCWSPM